MKKDFSESSGALFACMVIYSLSLLYGVVLRLMNLCGIGSFGMNCTASMADLLGSSTETFVPIVNVLTVFVALLNVGLGAIIQKAKHPIAIGITFLVLVMIGLSIPLFFVTGSNPIANFFLECCGIMMYFAWVLDLTYKEFCVVGNIYMQATICLMSALAPLMLCIRTRKGYAKTAFCSINFMFHAILFCIIAIHYFMPLEQGFDLCYKELNQLAVVSGSTYVMVNLLIFVILFVADLIFNSIIYMVTKKQR